MFTDGLDTSALQWVCKEQERAGNAVKPGKGSAGFPTRVHDFTATTGLAAGRGLPPPQLKNVHMHSGLLKLPHFLPTDDIASTNDDMEESVGSISAGNPTQDDYDSLDEQEDSGLYSPASSPCGSSPPSNSVHPCEPHNHVHDEQVDLLKAAYHPAAATGNSQRSDLIDVKDYYDRHPPFSRRDSFGEHENNSFRRESLGHRDSSYGREESAFGKDSFGRRDNFDLQHSAFTGSRKFMSEYDREEIVERNGGLGDTHALEHEESSSATELSDNEDSSDNEKEDIYRRPEHSSPDGNARHPYIASHHVTGTSIAVEKSVQGAALSHVSESQLQTKEKKMEGTVAGVVLLQSEAENMGAPPSAPPMSAGMMLDPSDVTLPTPTCSPVVTFSLEETKEDILHSAPARVCQPSTRSVSTMGVEEVGISSQHTATSMPLAPPVHLSGQAAWQAVIAYDACVRLCLRAWSRGCEEAPKFLVDECCLLRDCFGLQQVLLQPLEDSTRKAASEDVEVSMTSKSKRTIGKVKVQVRKIRIIPKPAARANPSASMRSVAYMNAGVQYMRQVSGILKDKVNSLRHSALAEPPQENFSCVLRLKSSAEEDAIHMQPGSSDTSVFLPESSGDDLLVEIQDSKGATHGRLVVHIATISDDPNDRVRWYGFYNEREHECVGKVQLFLNYTTTSGEIGSAKWGPVGETRAYDTVLEVAMRMQQFQQRNLRLHGSWLWLLSEFSSCYGVSDAYTRLRYLACIMEVATPTEDCLVLIHELLCPIIKGRGENTLSRQEKRILADIEEQVGQLLAMVFENYKSLDEASPSGLADTFVPAVGAVAPALVPAVQLYTLLHDILSVEAQCTLRNYFQIAARKRCKRHMTETDEYLSNGGDGFLMDSLSMGTAYAKMKTLCMHISSEVRVDIEIHNKHVLPSSIDLPSIAASIYDAELANRLRTFLVACPPSSPSAPVAELMIATADFQRDLASWGVRAQKGGVDAKDLFHLYVVLWIQDKRLHLLDFCKFDKERCTWVTTEHSTSPFVEQVYERIKDTLNEYEVIISRWPEYTFALENAVADVERAVLGALEKQYAEVLSPLKDAMVPKKFSLQYMQKLTRRGSITIYSVPSQLGVMLNSMKRLLDTLRPNIDAQMKAWVACLPGEGGHGRVVFGERLNEVTVELRAKYKSFLQAIVEKLADNARLQRTTKLKKILQDTREAGGESDIRERMQPLNTQVVDTISHLHDVFTTRVFVAVCRGYWDRMARDVLHFLENRKENRS
ncbi:hypothetical protein CY35_12G041500 [Sphagnum magellanicum]|nr:hypothetical protein CY35_12G041500 [Sphagnum magellanicum]